MENRQNQLRGHDHLVRLGSFLRHLAHNPNFPQCLEQSPDRDPRLSEWVLVNTVQLHLAFPQECSSPEAQQEYR